MHFAALLRILRYIKGTLHHGLFFSTFSLDLHAYSDADWAGDLTDRRSTIAYSLFLSTNPLSGGTKKEGFYNYYANLLELERKSILI